MAGLWEVAALPMDAAFVDFVDKAKAFTGRPDLDDAWFHVSWRWKYDETYKSRFTDMCLSLKDTLHVLI